MAQQLSRLRLLVLLLLLWLAACRYTKSPASLLFDMEMFVGAQPFEINGNDGGDDARGGSDGGADDSDVTVSPTSGANDCFETFIQDSHQASNTYASAYRICRDLGNARHMKVVEKQQMVRQDVTMAMNEMCEAYQKCSCIESDLEFFQCNSNNSYKNVNTTLEVYLNSTAAIVELEDRYQEAEKKVLLCTIAAEEQYMNESSKAYSQLSQCLKSS